MSYKYFFIVLEYLTLSLHFGGKFYVKLYRKKKTGGKKDPSRGYMHCVYYKPRKEKKSKNKVCYDIINEKRLIINCLFDNVCLLDAPTHTIERCIFFKV